MSKLNRDVEMVYHGTPITLPAGTIVDLIKGASGTQGDLYAVRSIALLIELTGNTHDPKYRYAFVPTDAVDV